MKTVAFAYNNLGCVGFKALLDNGFDIKALVTHPDDPNEKIYFDSVAALAAEAGIEVITTENPNSEAVVAKLRALKPDAIFSFYYRKMLSDAILDLAPGRAFNLHGSLLPKYRGRCPLNWALLHGETESGVSLHQMVKKADAGAVIGMEKVAIGPEDDAKSLIPKMSEAAAKLLARVLPQIKVGREERRDQDHSQATVFGGRRPEDGLIDWNVDANAIRNLVRAVTDPFPGAYSFFGQDKLTLWRCEALPGQGGGKRPGTVISASPLVIACKGGAVKVLTAKVKDKSCVSGPQAAAEMGLMPDCRLGGKLGSTKARPATKVLILGVNGFIGNALTERLLAAGNYEVYGMDLADDKLGKCRDHENFNFCEGDISIQRDWIEYHVRKCDVVLPLVAIATPASYVKEPLRVFELDFEENLRVIRYCVKYNKRLIFPSTSEVYGMCEDDFFNEESSPLVTGPINKIRWIYSCSKQLLDRVIWAYGMEKNLNFTLFRPFNWIGPKLDSLDSARLGSSRVLTQFALNLVEGTPIRLVDGGEQKRCFTDLSDGIEGLFRVIENKDQCAKGRIFNIGNPDNEASVRELAQVMVEAFEKHPRRSEFPATPKILEVSSMDYYGNGYQDVVHRRPSIKNAKTHLGWEPKVGLAQAIANSLNYFLDEHLGQK